MGYVPDEAQQIFQDMVFPGIEPAIISIAKQLANVQIILGQDDTETRKATTLVTAEEMEVEARRISETAEPNERFDLVLYWIKSHVTSVSAFQALAVEFLKLVEALDKIEKQSARIGVITGSVRLGGDPPSLN